MATPGAKFAKAIAETIRAGPIAEPDPKSEDLEDLKMAAYAHTFSAGDVDKVVTDANETADDTPDEDTVFEAFVHAAQCHLRESAKKAAEKETSEDETDSNRRWEEVRKQLLEKRKKVNWAASYVPDERVDKWRRQLRKVFGMFDNNNTGSVTPSDFDALGNERQDLGFTTRDWTELVKECNVNDEGKISSDEFVNKCIKAFQIMDMSDSVFQCLIEDFVKVKPCQAYIPHYRN